MKDEDTKNKKNYENQDLQDKFTDQYARADKTGEKSKPSSHKKKAANQRSAKQGKKSRKVIKPKETPPT